MHTTAPQGAHLILRACMTPAYGHFGRHFPLTRLGFRTGMQRQPISKRGLPHRPIVVLLFALLTGCYTGSRAADARTQTIQNALDSAQRLRSIERSFERRHPDKGTVVTTFVNGVRAEGLECRAQYRETFAPGTGDGLGKFSVTPDPVISCSTDHFSDPYCAEFRVAVSVVWAEPNAPLSQLAQQLDRSVVREAYFTCARAAPTDADRKLVRGHTQRVSHPY